MNGHVHGIRDNSQTLLVIACVVVAGASLCLALIDYWGRKQLCSIFSLFFSFSPHDLEPLLSSAQSFLLEINVWGVFTNQGE